MVLLILFLGFELLGLLTRDWLLLKTLEINCSKRLDRSSSFKLPITSSYPFRISFISFLILSLFEKQSLNFSKAKKMYLMISNCSRNSYEGLWIHWFENQNRPNQFILNPFTENPRQNYQSNLKDNFYCANTTPSWFI